MAPKAMKLMKGMKAKRGPKGGAKDGAKNGAKGCAKGQDKDKDTGIIVNDTDKDSGPLRDKGNGKGKDKGQRKGIFVHTLSGQEIGLAVHEFDDISTVKASLPIYLKPYEFDLMRRVNHWDTISTANMREGEHVYVVKQSSAVFEFSKEEEKNGGIPDKMKIIHY